MGTEAPGSGVRWSVAIFSSRETVATLATTVMAALDALPDAEAVVDVIINGNRELADAIEPMIGTLRPDRLRSNVVRFWYVALGDKAHAWNQYLAAIWPESGIGYFVDGYARVMPSALRLLGDALAAHHECLAAAAVPTMGRSAKRLREHMLRAGGLHGNLYAVRGETLAKLRERDFRLPLGLYYTDGLLGAVICFGLDPSSSQWDARRVLVHPQATWAFQRMSWWRTADLRSHVRRLLRQSQGSLERLAIRHHLAEKRCRPETLARTVEELVRGWQADCPHAVRRLFLRHPLCALAARRLARAGARPLLDVAPRLLASAPHSELARG